MTASTPNPPAPATPQPPAPDSHGWDNQDNLLSSLGHSRQTPGGVEASWEAVSGPGQPGADGQVLRALVREVLAEVLPRVASEAAAAVAPAKPGLAQAAAVPPPQPGLAHSVREDVGSVEVVSLRSDADLDAFVKYLLRLFENPARRQALRAGRLRFRLAPGSVPGSVRPRHRIEKGAVTEAMVTAAAKEGAKLVLGPRAVLTPLARDRARSRGVEIEKER